MTFLRHSLLRLSLVAVVAGQHLGPAAFLWPPDRIWSAAADHTAPCGSVARVGARTEFPLRNARISLAAQNEAWDARLAVSYLAEPKSDADFSNLIDASILRDVDPGHTCLAVADADPIVRAGDNATLQIRYSFDYDSPFQEFFYACADIVYVRPERFRRPSLSCFKATVVETDDYDDDLPWPDGLTAPANDISDYGGLSGGAVAGIVVAAVAMAMLLVVAALLLYRRRRQRSRKLRQQNSVRAVKWDQQADSQAPVAPGNVKLRDLS
ncbi:hypothetical protein XA68_18069 [Ophiocordyceps unilateralis]|uniref:Copper acquisition factor BIM1-like domain-containing protein n=1 Tax=Ophiocordyceps unilateralis TaxID=268505 RepID=A0A2A9P3V8_OPHUN|nr:hypothetical protein XA68_18069 [Ophiocordyceps unilateralis]